MKVRISKGAVVANEKDGGTYEAGSTVEVSKEEGESLIAQGYAEAAKKEVTKKK